ncbi:MAG TPA: pilus assembly protein TadG-related protein [Thermohalobaculum sp.]|nr:pilus assembly protein TadG-related protein [Thermohalobaculum sp.]
MFKLRVCAFLSDEQGGGTLWGLFWFMILLSIAGVSVDGTDAFRNDTMLQATADAAALAAVIDLPRADSAVASAVEYAGKNMPPEVYGDVLLAEDVDIGIWDAENRTFIRDVPIPDAVHVRVRMDHARGNAVVASFLRIVGFKAWELEAHAIAQKFTPQCYTDGLVARGYVDTSSNNQYYNEFCIHGQQGVYLQNGSFFELGTSVSMPDLSLLTIPTDGLTSNPGLEDALREGSLDPRMVDRVPEIMDMYLDPTSPIQPIWIDQSKPVIEVDCNFNFGDHETKRIYHVICPANKQVQIPANSYIRETLVIAESQIKIPSGATLEDVILASRATTSNDGANIHFSSSVKLGRADDCADGGGVQIFSTQNLFISSSITFNGVQLVSAKNVDLGASDAGVKGLAVQAGGNIKLSSNNAFGLCNGDDPLLLTNQHYRLVN